MKQILINGCARCGENHYMDFEPLNNAPDEFKWFGMCPILNQPVLLSSAQKVEETILGERTGVTHIEGTDIK